MQFSFIDASWIPEGHEYDSHSEENIKEILKMVKKHSLLYQSTKKHFFPQQKSIIKVSLKHIQPPPKNDRVTQNFVNHMSNSHTYNANVY